MSGESDERIHDEQQAKLFALIPQGVMRDEWLDHWTEQYIRNLTHYYAMDLLCTVIANSKFNSRQCLCYAADNAPELVGKQIQDAVFAYLRPAAEEAFAENNWSIDHD